ncbi:MAG: hypothetical protein J6D12_04045 [Peptostreptococcaceae bacterium]|nr:hypothetical protein [Peptostreptococcaceae bacterium]
MLYALRLENKRLVRYNDFVPTDSNWFVKAEKGNEIVYFLNAGAYNSWARTTCPISSYHIQQGHYRGYKLTRNF